MRKIILEGECLHQARLHRRREHLAVIATSLLGPIHRGVRVAHERVRVTAVLREYADANAGGDVKVLTGDES